MQNWGILEEKEEGFEEERCLWERLLAVNLSGSKFAERGGPGRERRQKKRKLFV